MKKILTFIAAVLMMFSLSAQELAYFQRGNRISSPVLENDSVTFNFSADYATYVNLAPSWGEQVPMKKIAGGVWTIKVPLPSPEIYTYAFIVDGVRVNDPLNVLQQRDGTSYLSMFTVPGTRTQNYGPANKRGTVHYDWYDSNVMGMNRRLTVYTPYGYDPNGKTKYPVLYLMHGAGGDEEAWTSMGRAANILDNLIEKGLAVPMIVVMPNTNSDQQASRNMGFSTKQVDRNNMVQAAYEKSLVEEIVPFIEKKYKVISKPTSRAIAGLSMGGGNTIRATLMYPSKFEYICPFSAAFGVDLTNDEQKAQFEALKKDGYKLYFICCGSSDFIWSNSENLDKAMKELNMTHEFYVTDGGHTWANWRHYLDTILPKLFK